MYFSYLSYSLPPGKYWHPKYPSGVEILKSPCTNIVSFRYIGDNRRWFEV